MENERVVLLAEDGEAIGEADKADVHTAQTPLHLAFSCYLFDGEGRLLLTRRALTKRAWPGVWTNSFCGHPAPQERPVDAIRRRAREELGVEIDAITPVIPDFRYRAVDASGIVENEICPVYVARVTSAVVANPEEVAELAWAELAAVRVAIRATPFVFSPWMRLQLDVTDGIGVICLAKSISSSVVSPIAETTTTT